MYTWLAITCEIMLKGFLSYIVPVLILKNGDTSSVLDR